MTKNKVIIIGAGITGLTLAWRLRETHDVTIIDQAEKAGGWIQTIKESGFIFELGPRSCRTHGNGLATLALIEELGLQDEVITPRSKKRYILRNSQLKSLPSFFPLIVRAIWNDLTTKKGPSHDQSIYSFISHRFGSSAANMLFDPLTTGIYAGNIHDLSIQSCFPNLYQCEQRTGSVIMGMLKNKAQKKNMSPFVKSMQKHAIFSLRKGLGSFIDTLAERVNPILSEKVVSIHTNNQIEIVTDNNNTFIADHLYCCIPSEQLCRLLNIKNPIPSTSIAVVNVGYKKRVLKRKGFGYLIPSHEKEDILGVVFDSSVFPQQNHHQGETRLTIMIGGENQPIPQSPEKTALDALQRHLGIIEKPDAIHCMIAKKAIPQYLIGHNDHVKHLESQLPSNVTMLGNSFYGVAVNDCIAKNIY